MKKFILISILIGINFVLNAQVGINTTSPHPSAALHITGDGKGLLIPIVRSTGTPNRTLVSQTETADGLLVYDDVEKIFYFWNNT